MQVVRAKELETASELGAPLQLTLQLYAMMETESAVELLTVKVLNFVAGSNKSVVEVETVDNDRLNGKRWLARQPDTSKMSRDNWRTFVTKAISETKVIAVIVHQPSLGCGFSAITPRKLSWACDIFDSKVVWFKVMASMKKHGSDRVNVMSYLHVMQQRTYSLDAAFQLSRVTTGVYETGDYDIQPVASLRNNTLDMLYWLCDSITEAGGEFKIFDTVGVEQQVVQLCEAILNEYRTVPDCPVVIVCPFMVGIDDFAEFFNQVLACKEDAAEVADVAGRLSFYGWPLVTTDGSSFALVPPAQQIEGLAHFEHWLMQILDSHTNLHVAMIDGGVFPSQACFGLFGTLQALIQKLEVTLASFSITLDTRVKVSKGPFVGAPLLSNTLLNNHTFVQQHFIRSLTADHAMSGCEFDPQTMAWPLLVESMLVTEHPLEVLHARDVLLEVATLNDLAKSHKKYHKYLSDQLNQVERCIFYDLNAHGQINKHTTFSSALTTLSTEENSRPLKPRTKTPINLGPCAVPFNLFSYIWQPAGPVYLIEKGSYPSTASLYGIVSRLRGDPTSKLPTKLIIVHDKSLYTASSAMLPGASTFKI